MSDCSRPFVSKSDLRHRNVTWWARFQVSLSTSEMCAEQTQDVLPNYSDPVQPVGSGFLTTFLTRVLWAYSNTTHTIKAGMHHDVSAGVCHLQSLCQQEPEVSPGSQPVLHGFLHSEFKISKVIALLSYWMITWSKAPKIIQLLMIRLKVGLRCENKSLCQHRPKHGKAHREFKRWASKGFGSSTLWCYQISWSVL